MPSKKFVVAWGFNPGLKKKLKLFLPLFFLLFFFCYPINASFFNPSPVTQDYGTRATATRWNPSGSYLAIGGVNPPNDLTIYSWDDLYLAPKTTQSFGSGINAIDWSPDGQYLAVGGANNYNELIIYKWDGTSLSLTTSKHHGTEVKAIAWSPDGNTLAVGGVWGSYALALYGWNNSDTLTQKVITAHGTQVNALAWHPDGTKLAVGGNNGTEDLILYSWNGSELTTLTTKDHGTQANTVAWSKSGTYLAVGGDNSSTDVIIYSLSGSTLTQITSTGFGTKANTLAWSFDDDYLAVGGDNGSTDLIVYNWTGNSLQPATSSQTSYGNGIYSVDWSPYSDFLAVAGDNGTSDLTIYTNHSYLNGTKNNVIIPETYLFDEGSYAFGSVKFKNGCTISNANSALTLALTEPFSGELNTGTGYIKLKGDLHLDSNFTIAPNTCTILGQDHTIYLEGDLTIPDNTTIWFTKTYRASNGNVIIDGNGHSLILGHRSQLLIDYTATLTLRNLTLKNTLNTQDKPPIKIYPNIAGGKLALDNVKLALTDDFYFINGPLFIHNDVTVTGTSRFVYQSPHQSYITKDSTLCFEPGTTLFYSPLESTSNSLLSLEDASSNLFLDNCTLHVTHTGMRLTKGNLYLDNNVTLTSAYSEICPKLILTSAQNYGSSVYSVALNPNNNYLAVGGALPTDGNEIQIFNFSENPKTLTKIPTACSDYGYNVASVAWSPDGNYLAVGGQIPTDGNEIQVFSFNNTPPETLTKIPTACSDYGAAVNSVAWSPDGNYLAVGGQTPTDGNEIQIFSFSGNPKTLTKIPTACSDYGAAVNSVAWSPDGNYLAVGGRTPTDGNEIQIFSFNNTPPEALTKIPTACASYGTFVRSVAWRPDGNYLAAGGNGPESGVNVMQIFSFNGISETLTKTVGKTLPYTLVRSVAWSPNGNLLAIGDSNQIEIVSFNGSISSKILYERNSSASISWNNNNDYIVSGAAASFTGREPLETHLVDFSRSYQSPNSSLFFGNVTLGPDYDLNVHMFNSAKLDAKVRIKYDNFN